MATTTNFGWTTPDDTALVKDGASAIRTLGNSIDTSMAQLKGGTTGQVLSKTSNTDMAFTWTNGGDITAVNAGTGISGGGTSGDVTITNSMATTIDAKGDLIAGTADNTFARLAVGSNNQVLTADSTTATGLKWATAAGWAPNYALLNTGGTALTGATTITISGISNVNSLYIFVDAGSAGIGSEIRFRLNSDTATNYGYYDGIAYGNSAASQDNVTYESVNSASYWMVGKTANNASSAFALAAHIEGCNTAGNKVATWQSGSNAAGANFATLNAGGGVYRGTSTISSISIISLTGNFDAGTIYVYGA